MTIETSQRVAFLKKIHLFQGLNEEQITSAAAELEEETVPAETRILREGEAGDRFFLIYDGGVRVTQQAFERPIAFLVPGDYFGEEALLSNQRRSATVTAQEETVLFVLTRDQFQTLLKLSKKLKANFEVTIASHRMARKRRFKWLEPDEVIYFLARKHPVLLWQAMVAPVLSMFVPLLFLIVVSITKGAMPAFLSGVLLWVAGIVFLGIVGWIAWRYVDWGNDYYTVTNQRVVWLEKVIGLYDSRQEAPLSTVLSVGVQTDQVGRILDYGDVIIRTFVGKIPFRHVAHPYHAAALIEEHWRRAKASMRKTDMEAMRQAIRQRLGFPMEEPVASQKAEELVAKSPYKPSALAILFSNLFKLRFEAKGTITYRKHWFVLLAQVWQPSLLFLLGLTVLIWRSVHILRQPPVTGGMDTFISVVAVLFIPIILWWIYQYVDWRNDIYQVTDEQIFDIDKTPLGREERKSAPLDNILSTEYKRIGFLKVMLNYGDVYITVGGTQLIFEDVFDPPAVQQDIDRRREARVERKKQAEVAAERERVADWFAAYHRSAEEIRHSLEEQEPAEEEDEDKVQ